MSAVHRFRMAMAKHLGKTVTPELAAAIEVEAFSEPDCSIDPDRFEPVQHGGYVIRPERLRSVLPELEAMHQAHWLETERFRHGLALNPDYEALNARDRAGRVVQFTVRYRGDLAGHLRMYLGKSMHTSTPIAEEDTLYMAPEHRGGFTAMALLRHAEGVLGQLGTTEIRANSKVINHADVLMKRMRYQHVANQFVKFLPKGGSYVR